LVLLPDPGAGFAQDRVEHEGQRHEQARTADQQCRYQLLAMRPADHASKRSLGFVAERLVPQGALQIFDELGDGLIASFGSPSQRLAANVFDRALKSRRPRKRRRSVVGHGGEAAGHEPMQQLAELKDVGADAKSSQLAGLPAASKMRAKLKSLTFRAECAACASYPQISCSSAHRFGPALLGVVGRPRRPRACQSRAACHLFASHARNVPR
jgi:hypothetical protein